MDVFGDVKSAKEDVLVCSLEKVKDQGRRDFIREVENKGFDRVILEDAKKKEIEKFFSVTPSVFFEPKRVETDFQITSGETEK